MNNSVTIIVSGPVGSGKSALLGEIEILLKCLGVEVEWPAGQQEKNLTHADWIASLEMYKPRVTLIEVLAQSNSAGTVNVASSLGAPAWTGWPHEPPPEGWVKIPQADTTATAAQQMKDCPHASPPFRYCEICSVDPCPLRARK